MPPPAADEDALMGTQHPQKKKAQKIKASLPQSALFNAHNHSVL